MKKFVKVVATSVVAVAALGNIGCMSRGDRPGIEDRYHNVVDPCWPERYNAKARDEVVYPFAIQAENAEVLAQTVWNYHFELGSDKFSPSGIEAIDSFLRKRPGPNQNIYVQTSRDVPYDAAKAEKFAQDRNTLDSKRAAAIQKYLSVHPSAKGATFNISVIDPSDPAVWAVYPLNAILQLPQQYRANLQQGSGGGGGGGAGGGAGR